MRIGLSLGGGGARGFAHIGVIKALREAGVPIDLVNGSSAGAVVGGAYALYADIERTIAKAEEVVHTVDVSYFNMFRYSMESRPFLRNWLVSAICDLSALRSSILSHKNNLRALEMLFGQYEFSDTQVPFSSVAVDLLTGETVIIKEGKLIDGVLASTSIPGIFPPVERDGRLLVDGCVLADVPARELRQEGAEFVIAIRLGAEVETSYRNGFDLLNYVDGLKGRELTQWELDQADFQITIDIPDFDSSRFDNYEIAIAQGYKVTKYALPDLERKLGDSNV